MTGHHAKTFADSFAPSVMVRGSFSGSGMRRLVRIEEQQNTVKCRDVLEENSKLNMSSNCDFVLNCAFFLNPFILSSSVKRFILVRIQEHDLR